MSKPIREAGLFVFALLVSAMPVDGQRAAPADSVGIRQAALDYIEGWYEGNAERMERAVHPSLAKRIMITRDGKSRLDHMGAEELVRGTASGGGKRTPAAQRRTDVRILDVFGNAASVRVDATDWVDYLQLAKNNGQWVIVNVLWELRPR